MRYRRFYALCAFSITLLAVNVAVLAQTVTRGPYLQIGTPDSVYVKWRTSSATDTEVRYGVSADNLDQVISNSALTAEHEIKLTNLIANTKYFYSVGSTGQTLAGDSSFYFVTSPVTGSSKPTRIWVLGDSGTADANAAAVRDGYHIFNGGSSYADLWLMLGDNAYPDGTDAEFQAAVFDMYPQTLRQSVLWPTLGNHDGHTAAASSQTGPYFDIFKLPSAGEAGGTPSGTEAYYSFDYGNIHFVSLESSQTILSDAGRPVMLNWLDADLATNTLPWVIVFWHHPPYTKGSHDSDIETELVLMRESVNPILEAHGVDLVLTGHSHSYERSFLLDGHYGASSTFDELMKVNGGDGRPAGDGAYQKPVWPNVPNSGAVYTVAGSSGKAYGGQLNHPANYLSLSILGSVVLDVNADRLDATFLGTAGNAIDTYTIQKGADSTPPRLISASAEGIPTEVIAVFSEALEQNSAENAANYVVDNGTSVAAASLAADLKTVVLTTSQLSSGIGYTLTVNNVTDLAGNFIEIDNQQAFVYFEVITESFQDGVSPDASYDGTQDTYLSQSAPASKFGNAADLQLDGDDPSGSGQDLVALLKWDISSIPVGATVDSAEIVMNVTNASSGPYPAYSALRNWVETDADWNQAASGDNWGSPGAAGSGDRGNEPITTFSGSLGQTVFPLNAAGLALVQSWIGAPETNHGIILASTTTTDGLDLTSRNSGTAASRPRLTVRYRLMAGDTEPPSVPENLRSTSVTETSIGLAWDSSVDNVGVTTYRLSRNGAFLASVTGTFYNDAALTPDTLYSYTVEALDAVNNGSGASAALAITTLADTLPPSPPSGLISTGETDTTISLSWDAAGDNVGVTNYRVYREGLVVAMLNATGYTDTGLTSNTSYGYFVTALDAALNESSSSATINVTTREVTNTIVHIGALTLQLQNAGKNRFATSLVAIVDDAGAGVANATVDGVWTELPTGAASENVSGVTGGDGTVQFASPRVAKSASGRFVFNIISVTGAGLTYDSSANVASTGCINTDGTSCSTAPPDTIPPSAPIGVIATGAIGSIELDWIDNSEADLASYSVYRADTESGPFARIATNVPVSNYTDSGLADSTSRSYRITALDISGNESAQSTTVTATTASGGDGTQAYVGSLAVIVSNQGKNWRGVASLMILDTNTAAVPNATVSGQWLYNNSSQGTFSGVTDGNGAVSIQSQNVKASIGDTFTFTVSNVEAAGSTYNSSLNVSSSGTAVVP